jgi:hypothetical protein
MRGFAAPPGSDGGQWLAFGHQITTGEHVKAGFQTYPPLLPLIVGLTAKVTGPLVAVKGWGILASVSISIPMYLLLRTTTKPIFATILAPIAAVAPYQSEVLGFGGYPQLIGTGFLLLSLYCLMKGIETGVVRWFIAGSVTAAATVASNILPTIELAIAAVLILAGWTLINWQKTHKVDWVRLRRAAIWWGLVAVLLCLPVAHVYYTYVTTAEDSVANAHGLTLAQVLSWLYTSWRWECLWWLCIGTISLPVALWKAVRGQNLLAVVALALVATGGIGLIVMRELRFISLIEIGILLSFGIMPASLPHMLRTRRQVAAGLAVLAMTTIVLATGFVGHRRWEIAFGWYRVVDEPMLSGLKWLAAHKIPNSTVIASGAPRGHNYGWWIEGYAHLPTYAASDPSIFFNKEERRQVSLAEHFLDPTTPPQEARMLAEQENIRFVFANRDILKSSDRLTKAGFEVQFENEAFLIMIRK